MCSRAGPPSAQWSRGPSLGLDSGRRHMDYRTEGNMDFVVQHQLKLRVSFLLVSSEYCYIIQFHNNHRRVCTRCAGLMTKDFVLGHKEKVVVSQT